MKIWQTLPKYLSGALPMCPRNRSVSLAETEMSSSRGHWVTYDIFLWQSPREELQSSFFRCWSFLSDAVFIFNLVQRIESRTYFETSPHKYKITELAVISVMTSILFLFEDESRVLKSARKENFKRPCPCFYNGIWSLMLSVSIFQDFSFVSIHRKPLLFIESRKVTLPQQYCLTLHF